MKSSKDIADAKNRLEKAEEDFQNFDQNIRSLKREDFLRKGGCKTCNGYNKVVTWSTMDGSGYDEFGTCPNKDCTSKTVGVCPTSGYPGTGRQSPKDLYGMLNQAEKKVFDNLESIMNNAKASLETIVDRWTPAKGKTIEVTRGSKGAKKGMTGVVFWTKETSGGPSWNSHYVLRVGAKDEKGETFWTTEKSCKVTDPEVPVEKGVLIAAKLKRESFGAFLLIHNDKEIWVPKTQVKRLNTVGWILSKWIAEEKGIVG